MKAFFTLIAVLAVSCMQAQEMFICADDLQTKVIGNSIKTYNPQSGNDIGDLRTWIPRENQSAPLQNSPIIYINVSFHVFLDDNGGGNRYTNNNKGREKLVGLLNTVNDIYSGKPVRDSGGPSDKVPGVEELKDYDTRIRFTLGDYNERIYFYKSTEMFRLKDEDVEDASTKLCNYISTSDSLKLNLQKGINVFFIASSYKATVKDIIVVNGGSGYTKQPTIELVKPNGVTMKDIHCEAKISGGRIVKITIDKTAKLSGCVPPSVKITGGGGTGASALVPKLEGGATAVANGPNYDISANSHVIMFNCLPTSNADIEAVTGRCLAHEFGHNLDLKHTYCSGGYSSATGCSDMKGKPLCSCNSINNRHEYDDSEYLSDIFGPCNASTFPHIAEWVDPYKYTGSNDKKITSNVMGGSSNAIYFSPMQAGQMHRAIALKNVGKYVQSGIYSDIPLSITKKETWDGPYLSVRLFRDIQIKKNGNLTLDVDYDFNQNCSIEIQDGGVLCLKKGNTMKVSSTNKIVVKKGGTLIVSGNLDISGAGMIDVQPGGYLCIQKDVNIKLNDYSSLIKFNDDAILGVNTSVTNSPGAYYNTVGAIAYSGNGIVATYLNNVYIQNQTISKNTYISGKNIYVGNSVTTAKAKGDVTVKSGNNLILDAENDSLLDKGVIVELGATLNIK